jgi:hypothetical protein
MATIKRPVINWEERDDKPLFELIDDANSMLCAILVWQGDLIRQEHIKRGEDANDTI